MFNASTQSMDRDQKLFMALDGYSQPLREAAGQLMKFFEKIHKSSSSKEVKSIIATLKELKTGIIDNFDDQVWDLNNKLHSISIKIHEDDSILKAINEKDLFQYFDDVKVLSTEAEILMKKAIELNQI